MERGDHGYAIWTGYGRVMTVNSALTLFISCSPLAGFAGLHTK
jgi:multidrug transporter EmrE-like cation transporter